MASGACEKPRIKCSDCTHRLLPWGPDTVIHDHLAGKHTVGVYPLLEDEEGDAGRCCVVEPLVSELYEYNESAMMPTYCA